MKKLESLHKTFSNGKN